MSTPESLRAHLLSSLSPLPNTYPLGLTVLASHPKRTRDLYPHAVSPPKALKQDWLVVLDSEVERGAGGKAGEGEGQTGVGTGGVGAADGGEGNGGQAEKGLVKKPRVLVAAVSAYLYTFPSSSSSSPPAILYISKVDSSGYSPPTSPLPLTRLLIRSFLTFFMEHYPELRVQLFARAQKQYLFANSADGGGKKVLGGMGLCKWWKGVYEESVSVFSQARKEIKVEEGERKVKLSFILPGYEQSEALSLLGPGKPLPPGITWSYTPPFLRPVVDGKEVGLAGLIPSLPDDPKTRFLEELVDEIPRPREQNSRKAREAEEDLAQRTHAQACLARVGVDEFWERMGFRQECASGDVTGFFSLEIALPCPSSTGEPQASTPAPTVPAPTPTSQSLLPPPITDRILTALTNLDFATRELAVEGSGIWLDQTERLVGSEVGKAGWERCVGRMEAKVGGEGSGSGAGGEKRVKKEEVVTMLQPRKKKKVV